MERIIIKTLSLFCFLCVSFAQFRSEMPEMSLPSNLNGELDTFHQSGLFDQSRLNFSHGFNLSMITGNQSSIAIASLNNHATYLIFENLILNANISLHKTNHYSQQPLSEQIHIGYDAALSYKPSKNSILQFRLQNIPHFQRY